jgi:hypothetical protein
MKEEDFFEGIRTFSHSLEKDHPEVFDVAKEVWSGCVDPREGLRRIMLLSAGNSDLRSKLERELLVSFGYDPDFALARLPDRQQLLERWGFSEEDLFFQPDPDRQEYMLHPLLQGMIAELLQFDGDVPELRSGPLPEGGAPAVPVKTYARNPLMIGAMLRKAREEVFDQLSRAQREQDANLQSLVEAAGGLDSSAVATQIRYELQRGAGIEGYRPGQKAALREVDTPDVLALTTLSNTEKRKLTHEALSTTQGRRSIVPVVALELQQKLKSQGFNQVHLTDPGSEPVAQAEWSMLIDGGSAVSNPSFNFIETAIGSLSRKLQSELEGKASRYTTIYLQVRPLNAIDERRVGWTAVVYI